MNDRFKFRGVVKLDSQNIIIYSSFFKNYDDELILSVSESEAKKQIYESGYKLTEKDKNILWGYSDLDDYYPWFNFECEIIEQCTGLKDKNGKLIYEGDIVKETSFDEDSCAGREFVETSVVCFGGGDYPCSFTMKSKRFYRGFALLNYGINRIEIEVIGNIHENPDLMEE